MRTAPATLSTPTAPPEVLRHQECRCRTPLAPQAGCCECGRMDGVPPANSADPQDIRELHADPAIRHKRGARR